MSRQISQLLGATEPLFSMAIKQLESISGRPGNDVRLATEIISKLRQKTIGLNLDPIDTTGKELYHGLLNKFKECDETFVRNSALETSKDIAEILPPIVNKVNNLNINKKCWVIKKSTAKDLLKKNPPKNVMKLLKYKSIDSLLKNENILEIYAGLRFAESPQWLNDFNTKYKNLISSDFEQREIELLVMDSSRWISASEAYIAAKLHPLTHSKEMGVVAILPSAVIKPGYVSLVTLLLLHYINEIRLYSSFFKLNQVRPDFAEILVATLNNDSSHAGILGGQKIHWRIIQRYYGKLENEYHPELFEPHVQPEDLQWRKAEKMMCEVEPAFKWWHELDWVGFNDRGGPVSLNLMDVGLNYYQQLQFESRIYYHLRDSLWNELFIRYMGEKVLEQQILSQLDNDLIAPETISTVLNRGGIK